MLFDFMNKSNTAHKTEFTYETETINELPLLISC